jgi:hypothetical protein
MQKNKKNEKKNKKTILQGQNDVQNYLKQKPTRDFCMFGR